MSDREAEADAVAVAQVLAGDREAFALLVTRYARRVHDLARRMLRDGVEAEDVAQQAFLNAFRALPRFDPLRPFRHWLLRITSNLCRNRLAQRGRSPIALGLVADPFDDDPRTIDPPARPDASGSRAGDEGTETSRVRAAIEALPETYRMTAVLRYVHGLSILEIAQITEEPEATVKTHLHRARATLAASLADLVPGETGDAAAGTKG